MPDLCLQNVPFATSRTQIGSDHELEPRHISEHRHAAAHRDPPSSPSLDQSLVQKQPCERLVVLTDQVKYERSTETVFRRHVDQSIRKLIERLLRPGGDHLSGDAVNGIGLLQTRLAEDMNSLESQSHRLRFLKTNLIAAEYKIVKREKAVMKSARNLSAFLQISGDGLDAEMIRQYVELPIAHSQSINRALAAGELSLLRGLGDKRDHLKSIQEHLGSIVGYSRDHEMLSTHRLERHEDEDDSVMQDKIAGARNAVQDAIAAVHVAKEACETAGVKFDITNELDGSQTLTSEYRTSSFLSGNRSDSLDGFGDCWSMPEIHQVSEMFAEGSLDCNSLTPILAARKSDVSLRLGYAPSAESKVESWFLSSLDVVDAPEEESDGDLDTQIMLGVPANPGNRWQSAASVRRDAHGALFSATPRARLWTGRSSLTTSLLGADEPRIVSPARIRSSPAILSILRSEHFHRQDGPHQ